MNTKIFCAGLMQMEKRLFTYQYTEDGEDKEMKEVFSCYQLPRKYSEKYENVDVAEQEAAYDLIYRTDPFEMENKIRGTPYEKYYLELGPDTNIPCFGVNYAGNKKLSKYNDFNKKIINLTKPVGTDKSIRNKELYIS